MNTVSHRGYVAIIEPDLEDGILTGRVINTRDILGFHGQTIAEAIESFHAVVDEYVEDCKAKGKEPNRPCSGRFNLRVSPMLHSEIVSAAAKAGKSLNQWVAEALDNSVRSECVVRKC